MFISDELIPGLKDSTAPVLVYRNERGEAVGGFVLRPEEFVTSAQMLAEARKLAEPATSDVADNPL